MLQNRIIVEPRYTTTSLIRPPRYNDHFILSQDDINAVIFTSLIRPPRCTTKYFRPFGGRIKGVPLYTLLAIFNLFGRCWSTRRVQPL